MDPSMFHLTPLTWAVVIFCAMVVGFTKSGIPGIGILAVPLMAMVFPPGPSAGIFLPMLIAGDILAVACYRRDAKWGLVLKPLLWAALGIGAAYLVIKAYHLNERGRLLGHLIGGIVLGVLALGEYVGRARSLDVPRTWWFAAMAGLLGGFTTMVANAAGPIWIVYLLALRLDKKEFLGTNAWIFLILNTFKAPFSYGLGFISADSLWFNLKTLPFIAAGAFLGVRVAKVLPLRAFNLAVKAFAGIAALKLLFF